MQEIRGRKKGYKEKIPTLRKSLSIYRKASKKGAVNSSGIKKCLSRAHNPLGGLSF